MKLFTFTLFMALFAIGYSWESIGNSADTAHPGKCVTNGAVLSPGEDFHSKDHCVRTICNNANGDITIHGCGNTHIDLPCTVGKAKHPNEPYPNCCEMEIICPEGVKPTNFAATG